MLFQCVECYASEAYCNVLLDTIWAFQTELFITTSMYDRLSQPFADQIVTWGLKRLTLLFTHPIQLFLSTPVPFYIDNTELSNTKTLMYHMCLNWFAKSTILLCATTSPILIKQNYYVNWESRCCVIISFLSKTILSEVSFIFILHNAEFCHIYNLWIRPKNISKLFFSRDMVSGQNWSFSHYPQEAISINLDMYTCALPLRDRAKYNTIILEFDS